MSSNATSATVALFDDGNSTSAANAQLVALSISFAPALGISLLLWFWSVSAVSNTPHLKAWLVNSRSRFFLSQVRGVFILVSIK